MKKLLVSVLSVLAVSAACTVTAFAEEADSVNVYVTIADAQGNIAIAGESIDVTDADGDGAFTINDALYIAHEVYYDGGAAVGYASAYGDYGLSLNKLWGTENGGSYGYYVNNIAAWSLADAIDNGDYINAFVYTDLDAWSDTYCYFDANTASAVAGSEVTLTLSAAGYDADWNPVVLPVEGAAITVNGESTDLKTDAEGKVTLKFENDGSYVISAVSDTQILVPPVCKIKVGTGDPAPTETTTTTEIAAVTTTTTTTTANKNSNASSPKTGDSTGVYAAATVTIACFGAIILTRKRNDEE